MQTVWDAVAGHAARTPAAIAVRGERDYTYAELASRASELAATIAGRASPGTIVALEAASPAAGAIAMLAAAQVRCPVLPVSTDSPQARRALVLADARPGLTVREDAGDQFTVTAPDAPAPAPDLGGGRDLRDVAYIIHTSGSTGRPKGVVVPHDALLSRLHGLSLRPGFGAGDSILAMSTLSFDISLAEMFLPLILGGKFVAAPAGARLDPEIFDRVTREHQPDVIQATPSFWRLALAWGWRPSPGSRLWCGGEILTPGLARKLLPGCAQLWNVYGPTETTLWATAGQVTEPGAIGLGAPLVGGGLCLAAPDGTLIREPGRDAEILLYGAGMAYGYLGRPDLTAQQFARHQTPDGPRLCYRTGDMARYAADGRLEFLGRTDGQIKLRGHRIELAELESAAEDHPAVREAVAVLRAAGDPQKAHIALFAVAGPDEVTPRELRRWMAERLPPAMVPGRITVEARLPRTTSGKVDRVALAASPPP
jgi:D-alanine--poly(phosphoribitol) ligase subunit 1